MRKATILVAALAMVAGLTSCNNKKGDENGAADGKKKIKIAVIPKSTGNEFWETVHKGADEAKEKYTEMKSEE